MLEFINALFAEELAGPRSRTSRSRPVRKQVGPRPAVELLWAIEPKKVGVRVPLSSDTAPSPPAPLPKGEGSTGPDLATPAERTRRREADFIARRLRGLLDSGEKIVWQREAAERDGPRPVCPGDIAILFRALTDVAYYEEALRRWDIDYYLVGGHAFYAQQEIYDVVNLLRSLANPGDEVSLAGVLRSPLFALLDETLFWLARQAEGVVGAACLPRSCPPSWTPSRPARVSARRRHARGSCGR